MKIKSQECYWNDIPLYIDLGPSTHINLIKEKNIDLLITHSHADHTTGKIKCGSVTVRDLYVPAYYPEYKKIIYILTKKYPPLKIPKPKNVKLVWDGMKIDECGHINILNPPLNPLTLFAINNISDSDVAQFLSTYNTSIDEILETNDEFGDLVRPQEYEPKTFVKAAISLIAARSKKTKLLSSVLKEFDEYDANKISIVLNYRNQDNKTYLLTGDADKSVFKRLIDRKELKLHADVLKMPHHGSKKSISNSQVKFIDPKVAICSHKNGLFGKAKDPHPNIEIIEIMKKNGIAAYYTNDVIKGTKVIIRKSKGLIRGHSLEIKP